MKTNYDLDFEFEQSMAAKMDAEDILQEMNNNV